MTKTKSQINFEKRRSEARERVAGFDSIDGYKDRHIATIVSALSAGLANPGTDAEYDALVMLEDVLDMERNP